MNLSTLALLLLAWQLLGSKNAQKQNVTDFLSSDTKNILECFSQLSSKESNNNDKLGAILQMISNPMFADIASNLFGNKPKTEETAQQSGFTNDEGYNFQQPTVASQEFFKPIENIADPEVKNKLYTLYENWYVTQ